MIIAKFAQAHLSESQQQQLYVLLAQVNEMLPLSLIAIPQSYPRPWGLFAFDMTASFRRCMAFRY